MLSSKPYLLRALYDWIVDSQCTPHVVVDALHAEVRVPEAYVKNGQIVLNVSPGAVVSFVLDNHALSFNARFGGVPYDIFIPLHAVIGIYARENGRGMMFEPEAAPEPEPQVSPPGSGGGGKPGGGRPVLKVIK